MIHVGRYVLGFVCGFVSVLSLYCTGYPLAYAATDDRRRPRAPEPRAARRRDRSSNAARQRTTPRVQGRDSRVLAPAVPFVVLCTVLQKPRCFQRRAWSVVRQRPGARPLNRLTRVRAPHAPGNRHTSGILLRPCAAAHAAVSEPGWWRPQHQAPTRRRRSPRHLTPP